MVAVAENNLDDNRNTVDWDLNRLLTPRLAVIMDQQVHSTILYTPPSRPKWPAHSQIEWMDRWMD